MYVFSSTMANEPASASEPSQESADAPQPPALWFAWLETVALAVAGPLVGLALQHDDPFFLQSGFPWPVVAPVLAGLRYGFPQGLGCAVLILLGLAGMWQLGAQVPGATAAQFSFGLLVMGMVSGEFRDIWTKRLRKAQQDGSFSKERLDEFTRVYHLIRVSHQRLEQRLAGGTPNLRETLLTLRDTLLLARPTANEPLLGMAPLILEVFMSHGGVLAACLFEVDKDGKCAEKPAGRLGTMEPPPLDDALLKEALKRKKVASVRDLAAPRADAVTVLLAVVPMVDVRGRTWGVVAIQDMHFTSFQEDNLRMLAILGGHAGDLLATRLRGAADPANERFNLHLLRALHTLRDHGVPAAALSIRFGQNGAPLVEHLRQHRRGLDMQWLDTDGDGTPLMLVLMPEADRAAVDGFMSRVEELAREKLRASLQEVGVTVRSRMLEPNDSEDGILDHLGVERRP